MPDQRNCFRIMPGNIQSKAGFLIYLRHLFAYEFVSGELNSSSRVVEIGSGEGYGAAYLAPFVNHIVAYDLSEEIVKHASEQYEEANISFQAFDGKRIPEPDNSADAVISFQVIEHVPAVKEYLKEIKRILKPGGRAYLTTPNRIYRLHPGQKPWNKFHIREYDKEMLLKEITPVFSHTEIKGISGTPEMVTFEHQRVLKSKNKPFIYQFIPDFIKTWYSNARKKTKGKKEDADYPSRYSVNNYFVIEKEIDQSGLDLLAICSKS